MRSKRFDSDHGYLNFHKWMFIGSDLDDMLIGNVRSNLLWAGRGNDLVGGGAGRDLIFTSAGNDFVDGGSGNDLIFANPGNGETVTVVNGIAGDIGWLLRDRQEGSDVADQDEPQIPDTIIWDIDGDEDTSGQNKTDIRDIDGGVDHVRLSGEGTGVGLAVFDVNGASDPDEPQVPDTIIWDIDGDEDLDGVSIPKVVTKIVVAGNDEPRIDLAIALDAIEFRTSAEGYLLNIGDQNHIQVNGVKTSGLGDLIDTGAIELAYRGGLEDETINGSGARDLIHAGAGSDLIFGRGQSDTFVFAPGSELDVVGDYDAREGDAIDLRSFDREVAQRAIDTATTDAGGLDIDFGNGDALQLIGVTDASDVDFWLG